MSSKRRLRRQRCEGKQRHATIERAIAHATAVLKRFGTKLDWYACPFCKGYHVGNRTPRNAPPGSTV